MSKWKINGAFIKKNPDTFSQRSVKKVTYQRAVSGNEIRSILKENTSEVYLEAEWKLVDEEFRQFLHDLYMQDKKVVLQTHLTHDPRNKWVVRIDDFGEQYIRYDGKTQRFDIRASFKVLDGTNDPIITERFVSTPHPFVINNVTNRNVHNFLAFVQAETPIENLSVKQLYYNLIENPGFELVDAGTIVGWKDPNQAWSSDIIFYHEGERCVKTYYLNAPISQEFYFSPGRQLTLYWSLYGDQEGENNAQMTVEFLDASGNVLDVIEDVCSTMQEWQTFWFTIETPPSTRKVRVAIEKIAGVEDRNDYIYIDTIMARAGHFENQPEYADDLWRSISYNGTLNPGDVFKFDFGSKLATINNQIVPVEGGFFYLPPGMSVLLFDGETDELGSIEATIRYDEAWR